MERTELKELHYITPIFNVRSIMQQGILSYHQAGHVQHKSVAMYEIQERRARVRVPGGRMLHEYVNLYICGRNPMLYKRRGQHVTLCVLSISTTVLDQPGVIVTDSNACSNYVRFAAAREGLQIVNREQTFAENWTDPNLIQQWRNKAAKCAEVLVPELVKPRFIRGVYVSCDNAKADIETSNTGLMVTVNGHLFFNVR